MKIEEERIEAEKKRVIKQFMNFFTLLNAPYFEMILSLYQIKSIPAP